MGRVAEGVKAARRPPAAELDARRAPATHDDIPGMAQALDPVGMSERFDRALLGGAGTVTSCTAGQATYLPGRFALVRYTIEARDRAGDEWSALLNLRVWPSREQSGRYLTGRLRPVVERAGARDELHAFETPAAALDAMAATVSTWPIDGDLPTLVDATDPVLIQDLLGGVMPEVVVGENRVRRVRVGRGHYGRQHRCVLRYDVSLHGRGGEFDRVVFGKVAADGRGRIADEVIVALQAAMSERPVFRRRRNRLGRGDHRAPAHALVRDLEPPPPRLAQLAEAQGRTARTRPGSVGEELVTSAGGFVSRRKATL